MGLYLRPATAADEPFLFRLAHDEMAERLFAHLWDPKIREPLLKLQVDAQSGAHRAQFPNADHGVIVWDNDAVGRMIVDRSPACHHLVDITILAKYRSKGIGTWVLRALCTEAEIMSKPLRLHVRTDNRAKGLYERLGFRMIQGDEVTLLMERAPGTISQVSLANP